MKTAAREGYTLVEMLIAAAIMAIVLSGLLVASIQNMSLDQTSRNFTTVTSHAEAVLEEVRNDVFDNVAADITGGKWNWNADNDFTQRNMERLNGESITTTYATVNAVLLNVTVTASWNDARQRAQSAAFRTYVGAP